MSILIVVHVMVSAFLIIIILLQQGKGADVGATFGGGGNTMFGAAGADNLLTKVTAFASFAFMTTSLLLALGQKPSVASQGDIFQNIPKEAATLDEVKEAAVTTETTTESSEPSEGTEAEGAQPTETESTTAAPKTNTENTESSETEATPPAEAKDPEPTKAPAESEPKAEESKTPQ